MISIGSEDIDRGTHVHYCACGARIEYTGHDAGGIIACGCGRSYDVEQINGFALIFERS